MNKAVFLDRDGVINKTILRNGKAQAPYSLEECEFFPGVKAAIEAFKSNHFLTVVVTNQPDVTRGWVSKDQVIAVNDKIKAELKVDDIRVCYHDSADNCNCRKPRPGMLLEAAREFNIDLGQSFMIGDRLSDIEAGMLAGCKTILITPQKIECDNTIPDQQCSTLDEACRWILKNFK